MYPFNNDNNENRNENVGDSWYGDDAPAEVPASDGVTPDTERELSKPDTNRGWRDADYTPQTETTAPPRYYIPEEKPKKEKKPRKKREASFARVACLCLVCALVGGLAGGGLVLGTLSPSTADMTGATPTPVLAAAEPSSMPTPAASLSAGTLTGHDIYELGCQQTVGISTEITTNVFGMPVSNSVSGSGFIITADGYIMSNYHVIEQAYKGGYDISVMLYDGTEYKADIVGFDDDNDVAVLKIDADELNPVTLGNSDAISVGDTVYAIGNPLGELAYTMTRGMVSAKDRVIATDESTAINMFQFDAAVNSGNSGGPVYNTDGQVVGIVTAKYQQTGVEGLGFGIPINDAIDIANDIITNGYVTGKAYMGITGQTVTASVAQYYNMVEGAYVYSVEESSCAAKAGLKVGDIITDIDGVTVTSFEDLKAAVKSHSAGDTVAMTVWRSGENLYITITFDEQIPDSSAAQPSEQQSNQPQGYPYGQGW